MIIYTFISEEVQLSHNRVTRGVLVLPHTPYAYYIHLGKKYVTWYITYNNIVVLVWPSGNTFHVFFRYLHAQNKQLLLLPSDVCL